MLEQHLVIHTPPGSPPLTLTGVLPLTMAPNETAVCLFTVVNESVVLVNKTVGASMGMNDTSGSSVGVNGILVVPNPTSGNQVGWHDNPEAPMAAGGGSQSWLVSLVAGPGPAPPGGVVNSFKVNAYVELDHKSTGRITLTIAPKITVIGP